MSRFEIVRSDAGWHARFRASNGRVVWATEVYTRRRAALDAIKALALDFGYRISGVTESTEVPIRWRRLTLTHLIHSDSGWGISVRDVDEREARP